MRKVVHIDIANDPIPSGDPNVPGRTQITKTDPAIGPLSGNWRQTVTPVMTVYKLVCSFINEYYELNFRGEQYGSWESSLFGIRNITAIVEMLWVH